MSYINYDFGFMSFNSTFLIIVYTFLIDFDKNNALCENQYQYLLKISLKLRYFQYYFDYYSVSKFVFFS